MFTSSFCFTLTTSCVPGDDVLLAFSHVSVLGFYVAMLVYGMKKHNAAVSWYD